VALLFKLTPERIIALPPGRHGDGNNLFVQVLPSGSRSWLFRYDRDGKCRWMGMGSVDPGRLADSLQEARRKAADAREMLRAGIDPLAEKNAQKALLRPARVVRFAECADQYTAAREPTWRSPIHKVQHHQILRDYVLPKLGAKPVADIRPADVAAVLKPLWRDKHEVALKTLSKIKGVLDYAISHEHRSAANPATMAIMRNLLGPLIQPVAHHPSMEWSAVPAFFATLESRDDVPALALRWLIATATRSAEARHATWSEVDKGKRLWTIAASRMKAHEPHIVPLSHAALAVLEACKHRNDSPYLFPGPNGQPISETSLRNVLRAAGLGKDDASLHGYRSSFRTWAADHDVDRVVAEQALAHRVGNAVELSYQRSRFLKQRREVMARWAFFLSPPG